MNRINQLLANNITIEECEHGKIHNNYFDIASVTMRIEAGDLKLTKEEISVVVNSLAYNYYTIINGVEIDKDIFNVDQKKLKENLIKLYSKKRLETLLACEFTIGDCVHGCDDGNFFDLGQTGLNIDGCELDLNKEEMECVVKSIKTKYYPAEGGDRPRFGLDIDNGKLKEKFRTLYE